MRKLLLMLVMLLGITIASNAEVQVYQATSFACKVKNDYGYWSDWTDWQRSTVKIYIDISADQIYIDSPTPQYYQITGTQNNGRQWRDNSGGINIGFYAYRKSDYHRCEVRLRVQTDGTSQLYIDYNDANLVYNLIRIR